MKISKDLTAKFTKCFGKDVTQKIAKIEYDRGDYLDIGATDPTKISYIPSNKFPSFNGDYFDTAKRAEKGCFIKVSKLLSLTGIPNPEVSKLASKWSGVEQKSKLKCVEMLVEELYELADDNGLDSCMTPYADQVGEFYENFNVVGMAFYWEGEFVARALLWREIHWGGKTTPFLDRIYTKSSQGNHTVIQEAIIDEALAQGWLVKNEQSCSGQAFQHSSGFYGGELVAKSKNVLPKLGFFPYIDTLYWVQDDFQTLSSSSGEYTARETNGYLEGVGEDCDYCGERVLKEDAIISVGGVYYCGEYCAERAGLRQIKIWADPDEYSYDEVHDIYYNN